MKTFLFLPKEGWIMLGILAGTACLGSPFLVLEQPLLAFGTLGIGLLVCLVYHHYRCPVCRKKAGLSNNTTSEAKPT